MDYIQPKSIVPGPRRLHTDGGEPQANMSVNSWYKLLHDVTAQPRYTNSHATCNGVPPASVRGPTKSTSADRQSSLHTTLRANASCHTFPCDDALSKPKQTDELSTARIVFRHEATFDLSAEYQLTQHRNLAVQQSANDCSCKIQPKCVQVKRPRRPRGGVQV
jgi:hypothetical protein